MMLRGSVYSKVLEMETGVTVLTPNEFRRDTPYRVAYILHGLHGNNGNWSDFTRLPLYAREYPIVCIMPEVSRSFYTDMLYGQQFFTYIADELPALCQATFRISAEPADTAIIGGSMGGYGALKCAFSRPKQYSACAALSSACLFIKQGLEALRTPGGKAQASKIYSNQLIRDFQAAFGPDFEYRRENDVVALAGEAKQAGTVPRLYLACGKQDDLLKENSAYRDALVQMGIDLTYEELPGQHDWFFFDAALEKALRFCFGAEA